MKTIQLSGWITEKGELELRLPEGLPPGEARITIEIPQADDWRPEDLASALKVEPLSGAEIVNAGLLGGWEDQGIGDSEAWLKEQRHRRREQRSW
jgi:hypothetical protein